MMLLSRFWYAIVAVALAASVSFLYLSLHQHNRLRATDTRLLIDHDRDIVDWYLRMDARRRLDVLASVAVDQQVRDVLVKAGGKDKVTPDDREPLRKRLGELATRLSAQLKDEGAGRTPTALFAVDARGRVVAFVNFDRANLVKDDTFELGGFPVVADALHGWLRDDTWVVDRDAMYRVVARPVVAAEGSPPVGAIVALRRIDETYAKLVAERTEAAVLFYVALPDAGSVQLAAKAAPEKSSVSFDGVTVDANVLAKDAEYGEVGSSGLHVNGPFTVAYSKLTGESWRQGGGFMVARKVAIIDGPGALLANADESDKKAVPVALVTGIAVLALLIGILATVLEHSMPTQRLRLEAQKLAKGEQDALPLPKLSGAYRKVAQDVNDGIERVIAKGGGASRKAANLEQILGPVPAAPQMSAFAFNLDGGGPQSGPAASAGGGIDDLFPNLGAGPVSNPSGVSSAAPTRPIVGPPAVPPVNAPMPQHDSEDNTLVARVPDELIGAARTGEVSAIADADEMVHWKQTFDDFLSMRARCGEPTAGLSFEKFQLQLKKNKEQLVRQYACRRVKFTVYEKEGKAALKATPIRE